jgi:hypothetical protein
LGFFFCGAGNCSLIFCHCSSESLRHVIPALIPLGETWLRRG